jgi:hypothetical protein
MLPVVVYAKGDGVGLWMEGTVSNVNADGEDIHLTLSGRFWFEQYRGNSRSSVEVDGRRGLPLTVTQAAPFFAMTTSWRGGAIRDPGTLLAVLRVAAQRGQLVRFELADAQVSFGRDSTFSVVRASVVRATDHDLR